jgi:hypothetical protein
MNIQADNASYGKSKHFRPEKNIANSVEILTCGTYAIPNFIVEKKLMNNLLKMKK